MRAALPLISLDSPSSLPQHRSRLMAPADDAGGVIAAIDAIEAIGVTGVTGSRENKNAIQDATGFARSGGLAGRLR
jgi:hypothetical protein